MESQYRNGRRIYSLSAGPTLPEWLSERARRNLAKRDDGVRHRVELLQDFDMPCASSKIRQSRDGRHVLAVGTYPPRMRCYQLEDLAMKFERFCDAEPVDVVTLGDDYGKLAVVGADRTVEFHAAYGRHETVRVPRFARAAAYERATCDLLVCGSGREVYRFNLEEGRFRESLVAATTDGDGGATCIAIDPAHALHAVGWEDGRARLYDARAGTDATDPVATLRVDRSVGGDDGEVTSLAFDATGTHLAAGTKGGRVALYDVRSSVPLHVKEHQYGLPIHTVAFHSGSGCLLSGDAKLVKIWRAKPSATRTTTTTTTNDGDGYDDDLGVGSVVTNVEGAGSLTHFIVSGDEKDPEGHNSGLILCASEQPKMEAFYCPVLGTAPRWCSHLENITEELEAGQRSLFGNSTTDSSTTFQDYKFLTRDQVDELNIQNLVGTPLLRGYMHGYFINTSLYNRVRAVADPFAYDQYRKKKIKERLEEKRKSRIAPKQSSSSSQRKKKSVNAGLADDLELKARKKDKTSVVAKNMLEDDRFSSLFQNPDYEIDEENVNFLLRNPSGKAKIRQDEDVDSDDDGGGGARSEEEDDDQDGTGFEQVDDDDDDDEGWGHDDDERSFDDDDDSSDDDELALAKVRGENYAQVVDATSSGAKKKKTKRGGAKKQTNEIESSDSKRKGHKKKRSAPRLYESKDDATNDSALRIGLGDAEAGVEARRRAQDMLLPLGERIRNEERQQGGREGRRGTRTMIEGQGVVNELTYVPKDARRRAERATETTTTTTKRRKRRSAKELRSN